MLRLPRYGVVPSVSKDVDRRVLRGAAEHCGLGDLVKELISDSDNNNVKQSPNEIPAEKSSMADWLKLNVGGTIFETSRSTLTSDCESILARMFEPNSNLPPATVTEEGCYQIDACPRGFGVVLNWLRYRSLILGSEVKAEDVLPVADYFRAPDLAGEAAGDGGGGPGEADHRHRGGRGEDGGGPAAHRGGAHWHQRQAGGLQSGGRRVFFVITCFCPKLNCNSLQMSTVASGMDDLWRLKCELSNISGILSNGFKSFK